MRKVLKGVNKRGGRAHWRRCEENMCWCEQNVNRFVDPSGSNVENRQYYPVTIETKNLS